MEGLQRSEISFRRSGSSGLIWDDKLLSGEIKKADDEDKPPRMERSRSANAGYRTAKASPPNVDPPSPKVAGCGICGAFGKPARKSKPRNKRKS